ncbi:VOC family protein [Poseidonocella sp. HB161398]|uniref:VOC family protein n=1 Tax=Poseidonocella sp. HB161398 TaxID=2320855 RepID=UPI001485F513|nr:VOC family protein [Poseidonocella sp. HB161398]
MSFMPKNFNVWAEIPVRDLDAAIAFYQAATGGALAMMEMGAERVAAFVTDGRGVSANLFVGEPGQAGSGPVIFLAAEGAIEAAAKRAEAAGGRVLGAPVAIPPGRYIYVADPDGNRIGLFEPA